MVRLKQRYILFDVLYPPGDTSFSGSSQDAILALCQPSPTSVNPKTLTQTLRKVLQDHYGDFGAGTAGMLISVKYFSNKTSTGILRCLRQTFQQVMAALTLMNTIANKEVIVRCLHVSGTIKKCENLSIARSKQMMAMMGSLVDFLEDFKTAVDDDDTGNDN